MEGHNDGQSSADNLWDLHQTNTKAATPMGTHTAFPKELQWPCAIDGKSGLGGGNEDAALRVKACVKDEDWVGRAD